MLLSSNPWLLSLSWLDIRLRFGKIATVFLNRWEKGSGEHFYGIFLRDAWSNLIYTGPILVSQVRTVMLWKRLLCATRIKLLCDSIQACIWAGLLQWDICKQNKASQCCFFTSLPLKKIQFSWVKSFELKFNPFWWGWCGWFIPCPILEFGERLALEAFWHQGREDIIFRDHAGFEHEYSASQTDT